jgi:hypothetical protein
VVAVRGRARLTVTISDEEVPIGDPVIEPLVRALLGSASVLFPGLSPGQLAATVRGRAGALVHDMRSRNDVRAWQGGWTVQRACWPMGWPSEAWFETHSASLCATAGSASSPRPSPR